MVFQISGIIDDQGCVPGCTTLGPIRGWGISRLIEGSEAISNLLQTSTESEYDLGEEGDLFKAPEPIIEEPEMGLDPMTAISMISCGEDVISPQTMKMSDLESFQTEQLFREVFYECEKELLEKSAIEEQFSDIQDVKIPALSMDEDQIADKDRLILDESIQKSVSSGCLSSMEWIHGGISRPNFLDFQLVDFGDAYGMRRAFSEGDIQTLRNGNTTSLTFSSFERPLTIGNYTIEERKQKLSRYRKKRTKRNFGRKIKYACRKALADSQPRVRGRFAKTEEIEASKK
ncbi:CCT domain [Macleaya cordata]|uniref:CCT domain n=1 Tax=Macleaya cordata TaxID=56857 RepID=A0A200QLN4_MACCD|nr:CCT domain [Macleaya cordata]